MAFDDHDYFYWQRRRTKKIAGGIKARATKFGESWWAARWLDAFPTSSSGRFARGRNYARKGQTTDFHVAAGKISGMVQGSADAPYNIEIDVAPLQGKRLRSIEEEIKQHPLYAAMLLNREMPNEMEAAFH